MVVIPVSVSIPSYGFLNDLHELRWRSGRYISSHHNTTELANVLLERRAINRWTMINGLQHAPNFGSADVPLELLAESAASDPFTASETVRLSEVVLTNDQVCKNSNAARLLPPILASHREALGDSIWAELVALGLAV